MCLARKSAHQLSYFFSLSGILLFLPGCGGTLGTLKWRTWEDEGSRITEIRSVGVEVRNVDSYRSVVVGARHTLYGTRHDGGIPQAPGSAPWHYGWCPSTEGMPVLLTQRAIGMEAGLEPTFTGIAVGVNNRAAAIIPSDGTQVLYTTVNLDQPEEARIRLVTP